MREDLIKEALIKMKAAEFDALPEELPFEPSPSFLKRVGRVVSRAESGGVVFLGTLGRRVAAAVIIFVILAVCSVPLVSSAARRTIAGFFTDVFEKVSIVKIDKTTNVMKKTIEESYGLAYVPSGYVYIKTEILTPRQHKVEWSNGENEIRLYQIAGEDYNMGIDNEEINVIEIKEKGFEALYYEGKGKKNILWYKEGYVFFISADESVTQQELTKMAKSCEPVS